MHDGHAAVMDGAVGAEPAPFGASWQKTMMWIYIVTDALLFSGLLVGYAFLRQAGTDALAQAARGLQHPVHRLHDVRAHHVEHEHGGRGHRSKLGDRKKTQLFLALTIVGRPDLPGLPGLRVVPLHPRRARLTGAAAGSELAHLGVPPAFPQTFFVLTGFHGSHVLSGLIILIITLVRWGMGKTPAQGVEMAGLYWHFVDLVWVFIFTLYYLL
jgi:cytochrome c oxidase subunit 3